MNDTSDSSFRLFPESASSISDRVDQLYAFEVFIAVIFSFLICALILYFGVKYRRGTAVDRGNQPTSARLEVVWMVLPLMLTMVMFGWGAVVFYDQQRVPPHTIDITVVAKQWMWKLQHAEGNGEINALHIPINQAVRLRMISEDVIHSFFVPAFRVKQDVLPGRYTDLWFEATKAGQFHLFCAEYCGTEHADMRGTIFVMEPPDYANWLAGNTGEPPAVAGEKLFERFRCGNCHKTDGTGVGPSLAGIFGRRAAIAGGGAVIADDQYLRDSILDPAKQVVAGYEALMPSFRDQLDEGEVMKIIAYLKTLPGSQ